jgi:hypothetical protein
VGELSNGANGAAPCTLLRLLVVLPSGREPGSRPGVPRDRHSLVIEAGTTGVELR